MREPLFALPAPAADAIVGQTRQWLERAVIGLNLCPFAKAVHVRQQVRFAVTGACSAQELLDELEAELLALVQADPQAIDTTLLIHPRALHQFLDFNFFLEEAQAALRRLGLVGIVQIAGLHPRFEFADSRPDDVENCTNRSPHPILHLLREDSVSRAVAAFPDASAIFERNKQTLRRLGHEGWRALLQDSNAQSDSPVPLAGQGPGARQAS
jgi:hypothetical protein